MRQFHFPRLKKRYQPWVWGLVVIVVVALIGVRAAEHLQASASTTRQNQTSKVTKNKPAKKVAAKSVGKHKAKPKKAAPSVMRKPIDWHQPSETVAYPPITSAEKVAMRVNLKKQRVYILINGKVAYTMYASSGVNNLTPKGHFQIGTRGDHFYTPSEKMGANYWTAFSGTGYLFHSVPVDVNGNYLPKEAAKLGKEPGSHGCVRLSIADAKWVNENIPTGTPVDIS